MAVPVKREHQLGRFFEVHGLRLTPGELSELRSKYGIHILGVVASEPVETRHPQLGSGSWVESKRRMMEAARAGNELKVAAHAAKAALEVGQALKDWKKSEELPYHEMLTDWLHRFKEVQKKPRALIEAVNEFRQRAGHA